MGLRITQVITSVVRRGLHRDSCGHLSQVLLAPILTLIRPRIILALIARSLQAPGRLHVCLLVTLHLHNSAMDRPWPQLQLSSTSTSMWPASWVLELACPPACTRGTCKETTDNSYLIPMPFKTNIEVNNGQNVSVSRQGIGESALNGPKKLTGPSLQSAASCHMMLATCQRICVLHMQAFHQILTALLLLAGRALRPGGTLATWLPFTLEWVPHMAAAGVRRETLSAAMSPIYKKYPGPLSIYACGVV